MWGLRARGCLGLGLDRVGDMEELQSKCDCDCVREEAE